MVVTSPQQGRIVYGRVIGFSLTEDGEEDRVRSQTTRRVIDGSVGSEDRVLGDASTDKIVEDRARVSGLGVEDVLGPGRQTI